MIEKLTPEQESRIPEFRDKWLKIGLSTQQIDFKKALEIKNIVYRKLLNKKDVPVILMDSPLTAWLATRYLGYLFYENQVRNQVEDQVSNQVWDPVWNQVWNQVSNQVENQVWNQVGNQVGNQVKNQVWNQVENQVWNQVENQVGNQVWNQVKDQVENQVGNFIMPYFYGQFDSGYFSFYEFMFNVLKIKNPVEDLYSSYLKTTECGIIYPCDDFCVISNKPSNILMSNGQVHSDGSPAIEYRDGFKVWSLNGVRVPQYLAETPTEKLDLEFFKKEQNADVKAEFIKKYGVQRMLSLGKKMDDAHKSKNQWYVDSEYELYNLGSIFNREKAVFLKMKNLTTGTYHVEGVDPSCNTVEEALKFRANNREINIVGIK